MVVKSSNVMLRAGLLVLAILLAGVVPMYAQEARQPHRVSADHRRVTRLRKVYGEPRAGKLSFFHQLPSRSLLFAPTLPFKQALPAAPAPAPDGMEPGPPPGPTGDALNWLYTQQNSSGSWGSAYEFIDTATVIDVLGMVEPDSSDLVQGASWLTGQDTGNHEEMARQIVALSGISGYESYAATMANTLWALRNPAETDNTLPNWPEGGWGLAAGYATDCMTTAVALEAIKAVGLAGGVAVQDEALAAGASNTHEFDVPADAVKVRIQIRATGAGVRLFLAEGAPAYSGAYFPIPPGTTYLITYPDNGLPFTPGHNYITVQSTGGAATYTLTASYETPSFDTRTVGEAVAYLLESQNADGGWGLQRGGDTELYTTLHVLLALSDYAHYDLSAQRSAGRVYLESQQLASGGFGYSGIELEYVTALGALALIQSDTFPFDPVTQDVVSALEAMQGADGSWAGEPYDTALAVQVLWEHNQTPTVNAGADLFVLDADGDGFEAVTLLATANDIDGSIVSYEWTENGMVIATGASPTVMLGLGDHAITVTVTDDGGKTASDGINIKVAYIIYEADMDTDPGWTAEGLWGWGIPLGNDGWHGGAPPDGPDPTAGCTGSKVYGYNLAGGYEDNLSETSLTTTAIDCSGYRNVSLKFCRWLNVEESQYDKASLQVSSEGSTWITLFEHSGATHIETAWSVQEYDISAVADGQPTVYIRWVMGPTDYTWNYGGWNIDDVVITGVPTAPPSPPALVSSDPADGYIDPRSEVGGVSEITLTFDSVVRNTDGSPLSTAAFTLTSTSGATPPSVQSVDGTANPLVVLTLSSPMEPGHWTTIRADVENESGTDATFELDVGYLPCDVDQSGNANISDATAFVAEFNGGQRIELIDTNRSGNVNISDATEFATSFLSRWSGYGLPGRP